MSQELVKIKVEPPVVSINYEAAKKRCEAWLSQYKDVVITEDQVSKGRELAKEINQTKQSMKKTLKERIDVIEAPIKDLKDKVKHLEEMQEDVRQTILKQIAQHDQKKLDTAKSLLTDLRLQLWDDLEVDPEFHRAEFDDLINKSSLTDAWNLTGKAKATLEARVRDDKALQDKTRMRLLELENRSHRAGLGSPLTRDHVADFLWAPDEQYEKRLQRLLDVEVEREAEAKRRYWAEQEAEAAQKAETEKAEVERRQRLSEAPAETEKTAEPAPAPAADPGPQKPAPDGKITIQVVATFELEIDPRLKDEAIKAELGRRMADAGITSLKSTTIHRQERAA